MPRQTLLVELLHERIGIELLDVPNARLAPQTLEEHHGTDHCRDTSGVAYALHTGLLVGSLVRTVVVNVVGLLLAVLQSADAATDRGLSAVVLAEVLRVRQHSLEDLQRNYLHLNLLVRIVGERSLIGNLVDARHSEVLYAVKVCEVLLAECHPETCALDGRIVLHERFNLLMVEQVALLRSYLRICERLVDFERLGLHPLSVFPVETLLSDLADIDFGVEVGSKSLVVVACVAVDDVEILNLVEVMLGGISGEDACNTGVEATSEDSCQSGIFKASMMVRS